MRICLFVGTALPRVGGAEIVVDKLARQWHESGAEVTVLAPRSTLLGRPDDSQFPYRVLRHPPLFSSRFGVEWYGRYLVDAHRKHHFEIIHCHGIFPHGYLAARAKAGLGVPVVFTSHGGDVGPDDRRYSKPRVRKKMLWAMAQLDAMIAISPFARRGFERLCPGPVPVFDIPNGVDFVEFATPASWRPADLPLSLAKRGYLLFLGRLSRRKGADLLIEAFGQICSARRPDLVVAGAGDELPALRQLVNDLGVTRHVHFVGGVGGSKKAWLLQNALCTVMPTRGWEAFPLVLLESLAAGTPVIASEADGLGELVRQCGGGLTFPVGAVDRLARTIEACIADADGLARLGRNGCDYAAGLDWSTIAAAHIKLFEGLCRGRGPHCLPTWQAAFGPSSKVA